MVDAPKHTRTIAVSLEDAATPTVFAVVGENRDDPNRLLLIDADGQHYQYRLTDGTTTPVEPDDGWVIDPNPPSVDELIG
ncbi:MAG: hypothetical protein QOJ59_2957 [Thermomicrobiales bacterium]|jgi:hypothetical protein|nr:hypothetical protein [Thermomicrobiales bacterium]